MELEGCYSEISNWCILEETAESLKLELYIRKSKSIKVKVPNHNIRFFF